MINRRNFLQNNFILAGGFPFRKLLLFPGDIDSGKNIYSIFKNPSSIYKPFVRWWWNGDKVERDELRRELRLLKEAGIGGVEINPVKFPARTNDLGKKSLQWLSAEWIDMLKFAFDEARTLGLTCDLIVGSGWPFGAEWLEGEERAQGVVIGTKRLEGPLNYEVSLSELFREADPTLSSPFAGRKMEMLSVRLAPEVVNDINDVKDLSNQIPTGTIRINIPKGRFVLYALVKIQGFLAVIQGAPGASGPVLNHYNKEAVRKYLDKMSDTIQNRIGPLSQYIRSLFTDSLELEGSNWCADMQAEFQRRRGYDLLPWLPFVLFQTTAMGNTVYKSLPPSLNNSSRLYIYGASHGKEFDELVKRVRYDFELTKTELITDRFVATFLDWCKENKVKSRVQAYGRGYFPLEGSFGVDIPEGETWIRPGLGSTMSETDYRVGRSYTVMNKYVSSAAHLKGKKLISCEELTNIHLVFNETLELMKIAGDLSIISGITHPIFHGFNYSPPDADYPGWVIYGTFINERNPWWSYFPKFTSYKARLSALLQQLTMFADIAILPATADLWSKYGAQNDPFPSTMYPIWQTLVWESIHQNGNGCDYVSEKIIQDGKIQNGYLSYGERKYHTIFLTQVESLEPSTAKKLFEWVKAGGRIFFIGSYPLGSLGLLGLQDERNERDGKDAEVKKWIEEIRKFHDRAFLINKPGKDHTAWFKWIQKEYGISPYIEIDSPGKFVSQIRCQSASLELFVFINSSMDNSSLINVIPSKSITDGRQTWFWDPETGERSKVMSNNGRIQLDLGPADLKLLVFDKENKDSQNGPSRRGETYQSVKKGVDTARLVNGPWSVTGQHVNGKTVSATLSTLQDLKGLETWEKFCGTIIYRNNFNVADPSKIKSLDLGKAFGVSEVFLNDSLVGTRWYGRRIFDVAKFVKGGDNTIEIRIVTTMGNYLKSLTDNKAAQFWTNQGRTVQPLQPTGLVGPVKIY